VNSGSKSLRTGTGSFTLNQLWYLPSDSDFSPANVLMIVVVQVIIVVVHVH